MPQKRPSVHVSPSSFAGSGLSDPHRTLLERSPVEVRTQHLVYPNKPRGVSRETVIRNGVCWVDIIEPWSGVRKHDMREETPEVLRAQRDTCAVEAESARPLPSRFAPLDEDTHRTRWQRLVGRSPRSTTQQ